MNRPYRSSSRTFRTSPVSSVSELSIFHYSRHFLRSGPLKLITKNSRTVEGPYHQWGPHVTRRSSHPIVTPLLFKTHSAAQTSRPRGRAGCVARCGNDVGRSRTSRRSRWQASVQCTSDEPVPPFRGTCTATAAPRAPPSRDRFGRSDCSPRYNQSINQTGRKVDRSGGSPR